MRKARHVAIIVQSCLIFFLLSAFSTRASDATTGASPAALVTCAFCQGVNHGDHWDGTFGSWCSPAESNCAECPWEYEDCTNAYWQGPSNYCVNDCPGSTVAVAEQLEAAVRRDDPVAVAALLRKHSETVSFNAARNSIQVEGCKRQIVANLPVGDRVLKALD